jgi:hypothetical protein
VEQVVARRDGYDVVKKDEEIARRIAEVNWPALGRNSGRRQSNERAFP